MIFDITERAILASLADILIPSGEGFPSAREADVAGEGLDQVIAVRPELVAGLKTILASARGRAAVEVIGELQAKDQTSFSILAELVPAAYFLNPQVRAKLEYQGQIPRPIDTRQDYLEEGL